MDDKKAQTNLFRQYLTRHVFLIVAVVLLCSFYILREVRVVADFVTTYITHPWHRIAGTVFGVVPFSIAEWLCVLAIAGVLAYVIVTVIKVIRKPEKLRRAYAAFISILAGALMAYSLLCWLWGIGFYSNTIAELSGIKDEAVSVAELKEATIYFAEKANAAAEVVNRDEGGIYVCDTQRILKEAPALYTNLPKEFDFLKGPQAYPKAMVFSYVHSLMGFTGFFFPLTGEANINVHAPDCFIPSSVAHELGHQYGVTREQDANFIAVMVCMQSGNADFVYSGALLAYVHLASALKKASYEDWLEVTSYLNDSVKKDLVANNEYWKQFETPINQFSENAYEGFLHNQGQELGMQSYGACVDLLVAYYGAEAKKMQNQSADIQ